MKKKAKKNSDRGTGPLEKDIENKVVTYAKKLGCLAYKFTSPSQRSVPDRLFFTPTGRPFFIEFKRMGNELTAAQRVEGEKIGKKNVLVFTCNEVCCGKELVDRMITPEKEKDNEKPPEGKATVTPVKPPVAAKPAVDDYSSLLA